MRNLSGTVPNAEEDNENNEERGKGTSQRPNRKGPTARGGGGEFLSSLSS